MAPEHKARRRTKQVVVLVIVLVAVLSVLAYLVWFVLLPYVEEITPGKDRADLRSVLGLSGPEDAFVMLGEYPSSSKAVVRGGTVYWDYNSVERHFTDLFWMNMDEGILLYTTADEVVRADDGESFYVRHAEAAPADGIAPEKVRTDMPVFFIERGRGYISLDFALQFSNFKYEFFKDPYRVQIYAWDAVFESAEVINDTAVRRSFDIKSEIISDLSMGDVVYIMNKSSEWSKVRTKDALTGYVENKDLAEASFKTEIVIPQDYVPPPYTALTEDRRLCLAWHQVTVADANAYLYDMIETAWPLDVVSPTWFKVTDEFGNIESIAWESYVENAHARGLAVWPLVDDFIYFDDPAQRVTLLMSTDSRNRFVGYMIAQAKELGFDGINLDFEVVPLEAASGFEQLVRELSVACRAHGLVFSIDNYPPRPHTEHYNRKLQGEVADYVIIMGYDEHWGTSSGAGSVASLPFVVDAIEQTLAVVPANKTMNAVPFYSRLWATTIDTGELRIDAVPGLGWQQKWLSERSIEPEWDEELGQNYAEYVRKGVLYQIWLEDGDSMQTRLDAMEVFDLGGVAAWRLGLEKPETWDIIGAWTRGG